MEIIKSCTNLEQSKKLAEFLPIDSADMFWADGERLAVWVNKNVELDFDDVPAWSLSALLNILPDPAITKRNNKYRCHILIQNTCYIGDTIDNPIDTCYKIILRLHKENLL